ncbi:hypothetical protein MRX96_006468 [Rhipicephalus microplus]
MTKRAHPSSPALRPSLDEASRRDAEPDYTCKPVRLVRLVRHAARTARASLRAVKVTGPAAALSQEALQ